MTQHKRLKLAVMNVKVVMTLTVGDPEINAYCPIYNN